MKDVNQADRLFALPVRRVLMSVTVAYLAGILLATVIQFPIEIVGILGALLLAVAAWRLWRRKRVLFCAMLLMGLLGNLRAGQQLLMRDWPTQSGVRMEGVVSEILKPYRVRLTDVHLEGEAGKTARDVVVTLMQEEDALPAAEPLVGQRVSGEGRLFAPDAARNPGGTDERIQALCDGYELSGYLLPGWTVQGDGVFSLRECLRQMRSAVLVRLERLFGEQAAIFAGVMLGDRSALDGEVTAAMRLTGTAHILTVSGLHLSMIASVLSALLARFALRRRTHFALLGAVLGFFAALTGGAAGTIRALIMALLRELARLRGRRYEPLTALSSAALCMTLVKPLWLLSASFQFSFFVVLSIQLFSSSFSDFAQRRFAGNQLLQAIAGMIALSVSAQLGAVPIQLLFYGYVPLLSLPMDLLCGVVLPFLLLGGWGVLLVSVASMRAGAWGASLLSVLSAVFESFSLAMADWRGAIVRLPAPHAVSLLIAALLLLLLSSRICLGRKRWQAAALTLVLLAASYLPRFDPSARYVQLDVGQGDAALFRQGRHAVVVDVGPQDSYDLLRYLRHEGLLVDAVILSHLDEDHAGALGMLLASEVEIPAVIVAVGAQHDAASLPVRAAMDELARSGIALYEVQLGNRIEVCGVTFDVLSPGQQLAGSNERSLLLHAQMQGVSFMLTGDLPSECEPDPVLHADVLKVAHHGSGSSTSERFLAQVRPSLALISVGANNSYGHPHGRVLDALAWIGADVLRTDERGCITLFLKDGRYDVRGYLAEE